MSITKREIPKCTMSVTGNHIFIKKFMMQASITLHQEIYGPETCLYCGMINDSGKSLIKPMEVYDQDR